ncbi:hypothetical protein Pmani_007686 [Petrolisthes manimaculis]|uniref:SNARE-complex protein Syntaxin-18 N-terminal domain-containing protein n=1 Tax=Petrolisthes manimaculis TaxID=1843537 RepID=A0AAE1Q8E5_9EUCA|nr:hypothetical protein Pmani_008592 [Petrolisthes manimaculis]KAK4321490.1 hypothetical protein Pmani_007686 [Petrolisthes manimaculis]
MFLSIKPIINLVKMTVGSDACSDLTPLFKSCVKTIRTRNKAIGATLPQTKIFPSTPTPFCLFNSRAKDTMSNIVIIRTLLKDHKKKYLEDQEQSMSDDERRYMDKVVNSNLRIIEDNLRAPDSELVGDQQGSKDASEYQKVIMSTLKINFQQVNNTFKQLKELRKKKQKEKDRLTRLQRPGDVKKRLSSVIKSPDTSPTLKELSKRGGSQDIQGTQSDSWSQSTESQGTDQTSSSQQIESSDNTLEANNTLDNERKSAYSYLDDGMDSMLDEISEEDKQMLEEENDHLYKELMSNREEVRQITRQVVELGHWQDVLTENVDLQAHQIEDIHETLIASTEHIREGNEQVREAMRKDAGFRVWILFFLIVLSCTILFLDWYNA